VFSSAKPKGEKAKKVQSAQGDGIPRGVPRVYEPSVNDRVTTQLPTAINEDYFGTRGANDCDMATSIWPQGSHFRFLAPTLNSMRAGHIKPLMG